LIHRWRVESIREWSAMGYRWCNDIS